MTHLIKAAALVAVLTAAAAPAQAMVGFGAGFPGTGASEALTLPATGADGAKVSDRALRH